MDKLKFPKIVAAVNKAIETQSKMQWEIGDALLEEVGPPSEQGHKDGSRELLEEVAEEITEECGIEVDYNGTYLSKLRQVAYNFPLKERVPALSWSVHEESGHPDMLDEIMRSTNKKITWEYARDYMQKKRGKSSRSGKKNKKDSMTITELQFMEDAAEAVAKTGDLKKMIKPYLKKYSPETIAAMTEAALEVANKWTELSNLVRDEQPNKRGHLQVVS